MGGWVKVKSVLRIAVAVKMFGSHLENFWQIFLPVGNDVAITALNKITQSNS